VQSRFVQQRSRALIGRRPVLAALASLLPARGWAAEPSLLDRAIARAGGEEALRRARRLQWTGEALAFTPTGSNLVGVSTTIVPFRAARTDAWLIAEGPARPRTLAVEGDNGWTEQNGVRRPMSEAMLAHWKAHYALYGLMRLVPLRDPGVSIEENAQALQITVVHPQAPRTTLAFDAEARLIGAADTIPAPDGGHSISQVVAFEGEITDSGARWPQFLRVSRDGRPHLELRLKTFKAGPPDPAGRSLDQG